MRHHYIIAALFLTSCGAQDAMDELAKDTPQSACEAFTKSLLNSPSSYKRVSIETWKESLTGDEMEDARKRQPAIGDGTPGLLYVGIEFDATNDMGATVRGSNICPFTTEDGEVVPKEIPDLVEASEHIRALQNKGRTGKDFPVMEEPVPTT